MSPVRWIAAILAVLLLAASAVVLVNGYHERRESAAQTEAAELKGQIETLKAQADEAMGAADSLATESKTHRAEAEALKAKLAKIKQASSNPNLVAMPVVDPGAPVVVPPDQVADDTRDQIIAAQDKLIADLDGEIRGLRSVIAIKDQALDASFRRERALEIALDAQKHATSAGKWSGRFQGFAVGAVIGYVGGRL